MNNKKIVIDTNVIISGLLLVNSIPNEALKLALEQEILYSIESLSELTEVLNRKKFAKYITKDEIEDFILEFMTVARPVNIIQKFDLCRDPKDNKIIELALNGDADYIITGDEDILALKDIIEINIVTPNEFLKLS